MSTPEQLAAQAEAVARVRVARIKRDKAVAETSDELRREIIAAADIGASVRDIAVAAGLTRSRIYQLLNED